MEAKNKNIGFDFDKFEKIEDIIYLDEPILTHYRRNDKEYFLYLVDTVDASDIYLLLEINEDIVFEYLTGRISLYKLIKSNTNLCYLIEQDFDGGIVDVIVSQPENLDKDYLPDEDSFLNYEPLENSYYFNFIEKYRSKPYLNLLRERAFYLKIALRNLKYSDTIGFNELASVLLINISTSYKSFLKADFFNRFKNLISDKRKLSNIFNGILPDLDYRMVDLKYGSFEIGLSVDNVMKNDVTDYREINDWAKRVGDEYREMVLNKYDNESVEQIINSYNDEERRKIFTPIFKIIENPDYDLSIKPSKHSSYLSLKTRDRTVAERIIPKSKEAINILEEKEYQIVNITTVVDKNKTKKSINLEDTLFDSTNETTVILKNKEFEKHGFILDFDVSVTVDIKASRGQILLNAEYGNKMFSSVVYSGKIDDGILDLTKQIYESVV